MYVFFSGRTCSIGLHPVGSSAAGRVKANEACERAREKHTNATTNNSQHSHIYDLIAVISEYTKKLFLKLSFTHILSVICETTYNKFAFELLKFFGSVWPTQLIVWRRERKIFHYLSRWSSSSSSISFVSAFIALQQPSRMLNRFSFTTQLMLNALSPPISPKRMLSYMI